MAAMARPLRVQFRGAIYHVMSRGSERRPIVRDDSDRTRWMEWLRRTVETYGRRLHAFVGSRGGAATTWAGRWQRT